MSDYKKIGYLNSDFKMFHIVDQERKDFSFHYHDFNKILIFLSGDVTYCIEGRSYDLAPNDIVFVNAGEVHRPIINSDGTYERIIIYISPNYIASYQGADYDLNHCFAQAKEKESNVLRMEALRKSKLYQVSHELEKSLDDKDYAHELYRNILFLEFMIQLNRAVIHNSVHYIANDSSNEKILSVLDYINHHLADDLSIDMLSEHFYTSKYYLMHSFKEETGYTIGQYLTTKRLLLARELIGGGMPITSACFECGFRNYSTFSRAYKKAFGVPPRQQL